jgi:hypothetical protein
MGFLGSAGHREKVCRHVPAVAFHLFSDLRDYLLRAIDNAVWSAGEWWSTLQGETGIVFVRGYWSAICVREGRPLEDSPVDPQRAPGGYPVSNGHTEQPIAS